MMHKIATVIFAVLLVFHVAASLKVAELTRKIDLTDYNTNIEIDLLLENDGASDVSSFEVAFKAAGPGSVAWVEGSSGCSISIATRRVDPSGIEYFKVNLEKAVKKGAEQQVTVAATVTHTTTPLPLAIAQEEHQYVVFVDHQILKLAYPIASQKTIVVLPSKSVLLTEEEKKEVKQDGEKLTYGPFDEGHGDKELRVHYEFNAPMIVIDKMEKEVFISHWSGITTEESYYLHHSGAALKEGFSRYDYQHNPGHSGIFGVRALRRLLPVSATDGYYRDTIGNISTSNVRQEAKHQVIEMRPRFPLFGGWKTEFYMGYSQPLSDVVSYADGKFVASFPVGSIFDSSVADVATIRVVLPEGATDAVVSCKYPGVVGPVTHASKVIMLDVTSSPYVEFQVKNLVPRGYNDRVMINVSYSYNTLNIYRAPVVILALLAGGLFLVLRKK